STLLPADPVSRQLLQSSTSPPSSAGTSLATDAATDQTDLQESAYLAGLRQFDRCSDKASSLADSGAALRLGLESRAAEAKQLPAEFNDRLRRHLAEVWLLAAPLRAGQAADEERSCRPPGTAGSIPESRPDTASTTHSNGGGTGKPSAAQALFPREASTWGFSTAVFSPDCPVSNGTSWTILIGWGQHQHLHQQQPQWSDILASTGVSERPILSAGNFNSNSSSSLAQKQQQQQRLLLGDCGFGLIVTERCVAFIARGGELAQRPVCRLPLSPASSSSSSSNGSVSLRVCIRLSLPPHGPAALAYEISEQQQQQQDSSSSSSNASLSGVELLGTRCSSLYPVLCVTSRVRVQVLEQPAAALVARRGRRCEAAIRCPLRRSAAQAEGFGGGQNSWLTVVRPATDGQNSGATVQGDGRQTASPIATRATPLRGWHIRPMRVHWSTSGSYNSACRGRGSAAVETSGYEDSLANGCGPASLRTTCRLATWVETFNGAKPGSQSALILRHTSPEWPPMAYIAPVSVAAQLT
uniref:RING-type domain-containing protein n=1 Tax=Macrostomum lignano TaxID=282301 RepID=A0A1I8F3B4_9PLAT